MGTSFMSVLRDVCLRLCPRRPRNGDDGDDPDNNPPRATTIHKSLPMPLPQSSAIFSSPSPTVVQVYLLLGQSNMYGMGHVGVLHDTAEGTLDYAVRHKGLYPYLLVPQAKKKNENEEDKDQPWATCDVVRNVHVTSGPNDSIKVVRNEEMTIHNQTNIGPEVGIGHVLLESGDAPQQQPILILKSCIGNRSLGWDLLPPGSVSYQYNGQVYAGYRQSPDKWPVGTTPVPLDTWYAGKQYDDDVRHAQTVLENLDTYVPRATEYQVAGFFFWQGDKDRYDDGHAIMYERNLVELIRRLRCDFEAPTAPFVLATLGQTDRTKCSGNERLILQAMLAVDSTTGEGEYPDLAGNVATVYTHPMAQGGSSHGHYNNNAEVYMDVGRAMGKTMMELLTQA